MHPHQRPLPYLYNTSPYGIPAYGTVSYQTAALDVSWYNTWPSVRSILLSTAMLISGAAIVGLDIANIAIEVNKQNGTSHLGSGTGKVGAGIWTGSITFFAAIFILVVVFMRNKRIAATFALLAVLLAFFFNIALIGLMGNSVQNNFYITGQTDSDNTQNRLLIAILSIALFILTLCITFVTMYLRVFFSSSTRQSTRRR